MKILWTSNGAKDDSTNVSVWIFEDEEEPALYASLLRTSDDSGSVATDKQESISVVISRVEDTTGSEECGVLSKNRI